MNTFLKLMITELQQQDPLNPMDNKDMLNQIAQIRAVGAVLAEHDGLATIMIELSQRDLCSSEVLTQSKHRR